MNIKDLKKAGEYANKVEDYESFREEFQNLVNNPMLDHPFTNYNRLESVLANLCTLFDCEVDIAKLLVNYIDDELTAIEGEVLKL